MTRTATMTGERVDITRAGWDTLYGHMTVMTLMRRAMLLTTKQTPQTVEEGLAGEAYTRHFRDLAKSALHKPGLALDEASPSDLYRMAQSLVKTIDEHDDERAAWYPDGWRASYDLIKHGKPQAKKSEPQARAAPPKNERLGLLSTLNYVSHEIDWPEESVLKSINRTRGTLRKGDDKKMMALCNDETRRMVEGPDLRGVE